MNFSSRSTLSKSRPFKPACMNAGPAAGTRNRVATKAMIEKPKEVYSAAKAGAGSTKGLTINHAAVGTSTPKTNLFGKGRQFEGILDVVRRCIPMLRIWVWFRTSGRRMSERRVAVLKSNA